MEIQDGLELSPRKVEYLKFIYERGGTVKTNDIASQFSVDPSTITKTVAEIAEAGYLTHVPYRGVVLTEAGIRHVKFLIKRHRILSLIFVRYGLTDEQACQEVSRFESFVPKDAVDRMCNAMGHPQQGICGRITHDDGCRHSETTTGRRKGRGQSLPQETS
jgi:DtxR family Mn-dependent transcriptional regulator